MIVEIWSDVMCPYCYLGKKQFEIALNQFEGKDDVFITWRSFELNPDIVYDENNDLFSYLSKMKGMSRADIENNFNRLAEQGKTMNIDFQFTKAKVMNSRNAHKLIQFAKNQHLQNEIEEALFYAYFTEGKNVQDENILEEIANNVGLQFEKFSTIIASVELDNLVIHDQYMAQQVGARGVPFFVFDQAYAVSGAQGEESFLHVLNTVAEKSKQ
jgi:predicted DsbA family dithiol-disulfide isomerase